MALFVKNGIYHLYFDKSDGVRYNGSVCLDSFVENSKGAFVFTLQENGSYPAYYCIFVPLEWLTGAEPTKPIAYINTSKKKKKPKIIIVY